jgi:cytochrome c-type biogenesis protein CcmF
MGIWAQEKILVMQPGEQVEIGAYSIQLQDVKAGTGPNYQAETAHFGLQKNGKDIGQMRSERRFYPVRGMQTTEAGIHIGPTRNVYVAIGEGTPDRGWAVRLYVHPFVSWIWLGALFMALGGFVALADRRLRMPSRIGKETEALLNVPLGSPAE